jgi:hypothetical protein
MPVILADGGCGKPATGFRVRRDAGGFPVTDDGCAMHARAVDDAGVRLRELRAEARGQLGLGAISLGVAVAAAELRPQLALPFLLGGLVVGALGIRALWRRWDLVDRLAGEREAYVIPEVLAQAAREATIERRRSYASLLRSWLREPTERHVRLAARDLEALVRELDDEQLALDPARAVDCRRLLSELGESPLRNRERPPEELRSRVRQIRSGFVPARAARAAPEGQRERTEAARSG